MLRSEHHFGSSEEPWGRLGRSPSDNAPCSDNDVTIETDEVLALRAAYDTEAFTELYQRYYSQVLRYCSVRLGNRQIAEDCTSRTFLRVVEALPQFRPVSFRGWLFAIAHNQVVDMQRKQRPVISLDAAQGLHTDHDIESIAEHHLAMNDLNRHLENLSAPQRSVLELRLAGLSGPEISRAIGKSQAWVRTTQLRAIRSLRVSMAPGGDDKTAVLRRETGAASPGSNRHLPTGAVSG